MSWGKGWEVGARKAIWAHERAPEPGAAPMNATERIREMACGCRYDSVTGAMTHFCEAHDASDYFTDEDGEHDD
jgi:hypothetical protein